MPTFTLHRAPWVVPVSKPVIQDGAIAVKQDRIVECATYSKLKKNYPGALVHNHDNCALMPPLVNAHIHLELSHILIPAANDPPSGFTDWIAQLLATREKEGATGSKAEKAALSALMKQHELGVIALGDIGNTHIGEGISTSFPGVLLHFNEVLGQSGKTRRSIIKKLQHEPDTKLYTAHAPYSTHPDLIRSVKYRARELGHPFAIHTAETGSENEMIRSGSGELFDFLHHRGFVGNSYTPPAEQNNQGSVYYLNSLGVLDKQTICVHCIHVSREEIKILADTQTKICLCPGSNRYLNVGKAPVQLFLDHNILPALGTDSQASNPRLSIWREMRLLKQDHPDINSADILTMATLGGAAALGLTRDFGTFDEGTKSTFLAVQLMPTIDTPKTLLEFLVTDNKKIILQWIQ